MTPSSAPHVETFFDPATFTATYVVHDPITRHAAIIDPVLDFNPRNARISTASADRLLAWIAEQDLTLDWLLETHVHADHLSAAHYLREKTGAPVVIGRGITQVQEVFAKLFAASDVTPDGSQFDRLVDDGDSLPLGELQISVMHTPGHTPADVSYRIGDAIFVGDTLFMPDYGTARTDFPGGSADELCRSIRRLLELPTETRMFVGHDYLPAGRGEHRWETTVGEQRRANVHIHDGVSDADYVAMRRERDATLDAPVLILPSLQVNIRAGALPPPSADGRVFLQLPVNAL